MDLLKKYRFMPRPDITAYELALVVSSTMYMWVEEDVFPVMPTELQRHYKKIDD